MPSWSQRLDEALLARLPPGMRERARSRIRPRPTRDGAWFLLLLAGVLLAAVNTGNNLLYFALSCLLAILVISNVLAEWNLRGIRVQRRLPPEAFARRPAAGAFVVFNHRRLGGAAAIRLEEVDVHADGWQPASAQVAWVPAGGSTEVSCRWAFAERGVARLEAVRVTSDFPFGFMRRERLLPVVTEILVYPEPAAGPMARAAAGPGQVRPDQRRIGSEGDYRGLRPYVPGDSLRDVHWPTAARTDKLMVIERHASQAELVLVEVEQAVGQRRELAIARAAGQVVRHFRWGHAVGLRLDGQVHMPRTGPAWRRRLLELLATAPRRDAPSGVDP